MRFFSSALCSAPALNIALVLNVALALNTVAPVAVAQTNRTQAQTSPQERSTALGKIFEEYWQYQLKASPETATYIGDTRYNDRWSEYTAAAFNANLARESDFITRLGAIDTTGLPEQERLSAELLMHDLIDNQEGARFKAWEMPVNQLGGPQLTFPQVVSVMPFQTVKDYDNYIARLNAIPAVFSQVQQAMDAGVDEGRTPPKMVMEKAQAQIAKIAATKPEESSLAGPLKQFPASVSPAEQKRIRTEAMEAITQRVLPSYNRFGRYLTAQYIPKCRTSLGATSLPNGKAYYAFLVRTSTTTDRTPEAIHQLGMDEVKRDEAEMLVIAKKLGASDLKSFNASLKSDPKQHATSADQLLDAFRKPLTEMQTKLPELFGHLPKAPFKVEAVPAYREANSAPAYYEPGTPDGKRPGTFFANTYHFADRQLFTAEAIAFHEGLPGHHLQISISQELTGVPAFRRNGGYGAFQEGWGLYAERLGKDVGFYTNPYDDYGRLQADIWRAIRLVVDTGVHSQGWTREQMVDFFHDHSGIDESSIQAEVDRYIANPGQALSYKSGQLKILELRQRAQTKLGPKFSLKNFHDQVLGSGALPLDILERRVDAWIAAGGPAQG